jgi:hypothetical protein
MKGQRQSQKLAALIFSAVRKLEHPEPIAPMESPMQDGWSMKRQAN